MDLQRLRKYPIFQDLSEPELSEFVANSRIATYDELHGRILAQGEEANGMGIILNGKVKIFKHDAANVEHLLTVLKEGDFFGEMALLDSNTRSANVQALEPTTVLWLSAVDFQRFLASKSPLIAKILTRMVMDLSRRLRLLDERYVFIKSYFEKRAV